MFHLGMLSFPVQTHLSVGTWRNDSYPFDTSFDRPELWQEAARSCENAGYDFLFAADTEGVFAEYERSRDGALREGFFVPAFDQTVLADWMAAATTNLGIVATISTTASQPYLTARRLASMDHLSRGRVAWNIVTSTHRAGVRSVGLDELPPHDERYDRAEEYVQLCKQLWNGWDADALVVDRERGMFIDPTKVNDIDFEGRWFKCHGPLNVHRSPQGGPMLAQAGASPRGIRFAARHAELIFAIQPFREGMRDYYQTVKSAISNAGRDPASCKVMFAMHAFIGETEAEAREKRDRHRSLITPERAMVAMSGLLGCDLSKIDPHTPVNELEVPGAQGHIQAWSQAGIRTIFDASIGHASGAGPEVVGTPNQIADWMCDTMEFVGGDGFVFEPLYLPHDLFEFNQKVVPILRRRGMVRSAYTGSTLRENMTAF